MMDSYDPATIFTTMPRGAWHAATSCGPNGGNCVEVNLGAHGFAGVRDGKSPTAGALVFAGQEWRAFLDSAFSGQLDRS